MSRSRRLVMTWHDARGQGAEQIERVGKQHGSPTKWCCLCRHLRQCRLCSIRPDRRRLLAVWLLRQYDVEYLVRGEIEEVIPSVGVAMSLLPHTNTWSPSSVRSTSSPTSCHGHRTGGVR
eukprot:1321220-Rhodomonas_salina.1